MKTRILFIIGFTLICQFILHSQCPTPTLPSGTSTPLIVCENSALTITVEGLAGATYNWQVSAGGTLGTSTTNTNTFSATTAGPYTVNVTQEVTSGSNQCDPSMELVIPIIVDATPTLSAGTSTNPSTCSGTNGSIQFSSTNLPNGSHTLNYKKGTSEQSTTITVSSNSFTLSSLTAGSYSDFSVTVNGCTGIFAGPVNLSDPATPSQPSDITVNPTLICGIGNTIIASISPVNGITYNWAVSPPVQNPMNLGGNYSFNVGDTGQYTISVSASINNCTSPVRTKAITVHPLPNAKIEGPTSICERENQYLNASGGSFYLWSNGQSGDKIDLSEISEGFYTFTVTVTDINGCTKLDSISLEVKNVPEVEISINNGSSKEDKQFSIDTKNQNLDFSKINFKFYEGSKLLASIDKMDLLPFTEKFNLNKTYKVVCTIFYSNGCVDSIEKEFDTNPAECDNFIPKIKLNNEGISISNGIIKSNVCEINKNEITFEFDGTNLFLSKIEYIINNKSKFTLNASNSFITIKDTLEIATNETKTFNITFQITYGTIGNVQTIQCSYSLDITNQSLPTITLVDNIFCYKNESLILKLKSNVNNTSFKNGGTTFNFNSNNEYSLELTSGSKFNNNDSTFYSFPLSDIDAIGNVCNFYSDNLSYRIYRTPEIKIIQDLCKDDSTRQILDIDPRDINTQWTILRNGNKIDLSTSGKIFNTNGEISVFGALAHSGGPTCNTDTVNQDIKVKPLPSAKISSYTKDCGPFYKVDSLSTVTNQNARYTWKLGNDTTGILDIYNKKQIIGVTGSGILSLTQEKDGCYDHDTIAIKNSTNFTLSPDTILYRACNTDTLYYLRNFKDGDCYRWMYINPDGDIKELTDVDKPYVKLNNKNQPLLIVYGCNEPCTGTVVTNRSSGADHDCSEDMSKQDKPIEIRPNPAYDLVELYSNFKHKGKYDIYVNDITGRRIVHFVMLHDRGSFTLPFDVSGWQSGLYFVSIGSETKKLIVIK